jgi:hypothetical protein
MVDTNPVERFTNNKLVISYAKLYEPEQVFLTPWNFQNEYMNRKWKWTTYIAMICINGGKAQLVRRKKDNYSPELSPDASLEELMAWATSVELVLLQALFFKSDDRLRVIAPRLLPSVSRRDAFDLLLAAFERRVREYEKVLHQVGDDVGGLGDVLGSLVTSYLFEPQKSSEFEGFVTYDENSSVVTKTTEIISA